MLVSVVFCGGTRWRASRPQAQTAAAANAAEQKQSRYQIGQMERVLEGAVEHGVTNIRDRLQALGPTEMLITDNARARGFRLDGYGVFFDVVAPSFDTTVLWSIRDARPERSRARQRAEGPRVARQGCGRRQPRAGAQAYRAADEPRAAHPDGRARRGRGASATRPGRPRPPALTTRGRRSIRSSPIPTRPTGPRSPGR